MKRIGVLLLVLLVLSQALTVTAFAASDDGGGIGDVISAIGNFIWDVVDAIFDAVDWLLDGLKALFIPRQNYLRDMVKRVHGKLQEKLGGPVSTFSYLKNRFAKLKAYPNLSKNFTIQFPPGHLLAGIRINLIKDAGNVMVMVRGAFSGLVALTTAAFCYKKLVALLNT